MTLAIKLILTPLFIGSVTLAGRRWGPVASGLLIGLPLTSGPISVILAYEYGTAFAAKAAVGNLVGLASVCVFCLVYTRIAPRANWLISALVALAAFPAATFFWNLFPWQPWPAFVLLMTMIVVVSRLIPYHALAQRELTPPAWDLPARMIVATTFVLVLTTFADRLGPQLSGLISPAPIFAVVLAAFTHSQQGASSASNLLRGVVLGSTAYALFFLTICVLLTRLGILGTYPFALMIAILASGVVYLITRQKEPSP